ncbi:MAG: SDR family oxidoreductase [Candidatus Bathyarchaeota archaeon]|nr:SDR family oxidoreductase [Candidatus Bathyarchaeota archaeon]
MKLKDKVALVTGGGRGIGQAVALAFAREGAQIVVASRTRSELNDTVNQIKTLGAEAASKEVDVSNPDSVNSLVDFAVDRFSKIDVLVNCAGMFGPIGPLFKNDVAKWIATINVNLIGTVLCCKSVLPFMIKQRSGKIINMSGGGAANPHPNFSAYGASKAAVVRFTETISEELKDYNIQVNAIAPGGIATSLQDDVIAAGELAGKEGLANAQKIKATGGTPMEKPVSLAVFLASKESDWLSGKLISAVWDDWQNMPRTVALSDIYTLRRVTKNWIEG